jgi:hypothetical protein
MMIGRRRFILGTGGLVVISPALAERISSPAIARLPAERRENSSPVSPPEDETNTSSVAFGIEGWDVPVGESAAGLVLISVNQAWKAAWR